MNSATCELLEQHFDTAFTAPDGIKKLRELILTLAMQGKLVPQDASDPPANQLLKNIEAEKSRLWRDGKIKAPKSLPAIKPEVVPYLLPQGWEWVRLGEICDYNGRANIEPESVAANTWLLDLEDIEKNTSRLLYRAKYSERQSKSTKSTFQKGDVLYGKLRPYLDKVLVADADGVCTTEIVPIVPSISINSEFLRWLLKRPAFLDHVNSLMYGVKMPRLGTEDAVQSIHPLPPRPEQHRIAAKIDQLMARCDELERLRTEREQKRRSVHTAALKQLLDAQAADGIADAWQFISRHFGDLYAVKENVAELRKAVLQLAVMGKLVPQNPNDSPASQLLKEIETEKSLLVKEGKVRGARRLDNAKVFESNELPYELPEGWEWARLSSVFDTTSGNTLDPALEKGSGAFAYVKVGDMNLPGNELVITTSSRFVDPDEKTGRSLIPTGSIIFPKRGGAIATNKKRIVGKPIFVDLNTMAITPKHGVLTDYAYFWLLTIDLASLNTGTSVPQINHQDIDPLPFPLPPHFEQHRIVTKIKQLMALCDTLEQQIDAATSKQTELLDALMAPV